MQIPDIISSWERLKHDNDLFLVKGSLGLVWYSTEQGPALSSLLICPPQPIRFFSPHGPRWLLKLQLSHPHSIQQQEGREKEGYNLPFRSPFHKYQMLTSY